MIEWTYRPIERWPRELTAERSNAPYRADWKSTVRVVRHELAALQAETVIFELAVTEREINQDGRLRADHRLQHPGVIVAFQSNVGPLKLPCDTFKEWAHNVRAIALHLEHLRLAGLYGVGRFGEQYRGWKALPDSSSLTPAMTVDQAAAFLHQVTGTLYVAILEVTESFREAYRRAAVKFHPDRGGNPETWNQLQEAARVLKNHHKL